MSTRGDDLVLLSTHASTLVDGWDTKVVVGRETRWHHHAGLLSQLRDEVTLASGGPDDGNASGKAVVAKMPGNEPALSLLIFVERRIGELVVWTGAQVPSGDVTWNLAWLSRLAADLSDEDLHHLAREVGLLRHRIAAQLAWTPPLRMLRGACPVCSELSSLSVFMGEYGPEAAQCRSCQTAWHGEDELGRLASAMDEAKEKSA
jgi:hypothetical protein